MASDNKLTRAWTNLRAAIHDVADVDGNRARKELQVLDEIARLAILEYSGGTAAERKDDDK